MPVTTAMARGLAPVLAQARGAVMAASAAVAGHDHRWHRSARNNDCRAWHVTGRAMRPAMAIAHSGADCGAHASAHGCANDGTGGAARLMSDDGPAGSADRAPNQGARALIGGMRSTRERAAE